MPTSASVSTSALFVSDVDAGATFDDPDDLKLSDAGAPFVVVRIRDHSFFRMRFSSVRAQTSQRSSCTSPVVAARAVSPPAARASFHKLL